MSVTPELVRELSQKIDAYETDKAPLSSLQQENVTALRDALEQKHAHDRALRDTLRAACGTVSANPWTFLTGGCRLVGDIRAVLNERRFHVESLYEAQLVSLTQALLAAQKEVEMLKKQTQVEYLKKLEGYLDAAQQLNDRYAKQLAASEARYESLEKKLEVTQGLLENLQAQDALIQPVPALPATSVSSNEPVAAPAPSVPMALPLRERRLSC